MSIKPIWRMPVVATAPLAPPSKAVPAPPTPSTSPIPGAGFDPALNSNRANQLDGNTAHVAPQRANFELAGVVSSKPRVLVVDIGGTNLKLKAPGHDEFKTPSGTDFTPEAMVKAIQEASRDWEFDVISMGFPGVVKDDSVVTEPKNLGKGWVDFDFAKALGKPVKMVNDAAMQALGSATKPGLTLFLGVGTGLGVALVIAEEREDGTLEKRVIPTELGHANSSKSEEYESLVGKAALEDDGKEQWTNQLVTVVNELKGLLNPDSIVIGGGNVKKLDDFRSKFPDSSISAGDNDFAFVGGEAMWDR
jgi:polyphosphate glucokinase